MNFARPRTRYCQDSENFQPTTTTTNFRLVLRNRADSNPLFSVHRSTPSRYSCVRIWLDKSISAVMHGRFPITTSRQIRDGQQHSGQPSLPESPWRKSPYRAGTPAFPLLFFFISPRHSSFFRFLFFSVVSALCLKF